MESSLTESWDPMRRSSRSEGLLVVANKHKQIGIRQGAPSFNMRTIFIKQNENIDNSQELKGPSENFRNP
jgi:hypothetical protein